MYIGASATTISAGYVVRMTTVDREIFAVEIFSQLRQSAKIVLAN